MSARLSLGTFLVAAVAAGCGAVVASSPTAIPTPATATSTGFDVSGITARDLTPAALGVETSTQPMSDSKQWGAKQAQVVEATTAQDFSDSPVQQMAARWESIRLAVAERDRAKANRDAPVVAIGYLAPGQAPDGMGGVRIGTELSQKGSVSDAELQKAAAAVGLTVTSRWDYAITGLDPAPVVILRADDPKAYFDQGYGLAGALKLPVDAAMLVLVHSSGTLLSAVGYDSAAGISMSYLDPQYGCNGPAEWCASQNVG
jgi:hypothetical protein